MNWKIFNLSAGECKSFVLVNIGGNKVIRGGNNIADGLVNDSNCIVAMEVVTRRGFGHVDKENARFEIFFEVIII